MPTPHVSFAIRRDRVIDAYSAAKSSLKEGVVPGGSLSLLKSTKCLDKMLKEDTTLSDDEKIGVRIMRQALEYPARKIYENAGLDASLIVSRLLEHGESENIGYDALKNEYVDMFENGIVDPTFVEVSVVQNASSVASLLLTTTCAIVDDPENEKNLPQVPPMMQ